MKPLRFAALVSAWCLPWMAAAAPFAYITNQGDHTVSVIDLASNTVASTVAVDRSPAGVVAVGRVGKVFITAPDSNAVSVVDMRSHHLIATLPAGQGAVGIAASPDGRRVYVADWYGQQLLGFDTRTHREVLRVAIGRAPAGVAVSADNRSVFVAERDDNRIAVIEVGDAGGAGRGRQAGRVIARIDVQQHPFALLFDAPRRRLYALNVLSDSVSVIDVRKPAAPRVLGHVKVGRAPYGAALTPDGQRLYITNQHDDTVSVLDPNALTVLQTLTGFGYPEGVAAAGQRIVVVNWMDENVSVLEAATGKLITQVATGRNPRGFGAFVGQPAALQR